MLIPFDLLVAMLFLGHYAEMPLASPLPLAESLSWIAAGMATVAATSSITCFTTLRWLRKRRPVLARRRQIAATAEWLARLILVSAFVYFLSISTMPWAVLRALGRSPEPGSIWAQTIGLGQFILYFIAAWLPMYPLHREVSYGRWTIISFLVDKARYNLFMLLAWLPFALLADWLSSLIVALPFLFLAAAWTFPYLLARVWGCKPVTDPDLLARVARLEKRAGVCFSKVLLWEPGGGNVQNAAAVGLFRPFRYLFLTPALVRNMDGDELEAVILHELGHVRHRHLLFYLFTSLAGVNVAVVLAAFTPGLGPTGRFIVTALTIVLYFRFGFGWLSRIMERQADLFSLETSGTSRPMVNALEKLGISAGNIRRHHSWHHLGIAERVAFLRRAEQDERLATRHQRLSRATQRGGYLLSLAVLFGIVWLAAFELGAGTAPPPSTARETEAHWRRVMTLLPGNPVAPLELAYHLAGDPAMHHEAVILAGKARILACDREEKAAAEKLIQELGDVPVPVSNPQTGGQG